MPCAQADRQYCALFVVSDDLQLTTDGIVLATVEVFPVTLKYQRYAHKMCRCCCCIGVQIENNFVVLCHTVETMRVM